MHDSSSSRKDNDGLWITIVVSVKTRVVVNDSSGSGNDNGSLCMTAVVRVRTMMVCG